MTDPQNLLSDANTPGEALAELVQSHPDLQAQIAQHPNAYVELLDWLANYGTPEAQTAARARLQAAPSAQPVQPSPSQLQSVQPVQPAQPAQAAPSYQPVHPAHPVQPQSVQPVRPGEAHEPPGEPSRGDQNQVPEPAAKKKLPVVIALLVAAVVLVGGGLVWFLAGNKSTENDENFAAALSVLNQSIETAEKQVGEAQEAVEELRALVDSAEDGEGGAGDGSEDSSENGAKDNSEAEALIVTALDVVQETEESLEEVTSSLKDAKEVAISAGEEGAKTEETLTRVREVTETLNASVVHLDEATTHVRETSEELSGTLGTSVETAPKEKDKPDKTQGMNLKQIAAGDYSSVAGVWKNGDGHTLEIEGDTIHYYTHLGHNPSEPVAIFIDNKVIEGADRGRVCVEPLIEDSDGGLVKLWEHCTQDHHLAEYRPILEFAPVGVPIHTDVPIQMPDGEVLRSSVRPSDETVERIHASIGGYSQATPLEYASEDPDFFFTRVD